LPAPAHLRARGHAARLLAHGAGHLRGGLSAGELIHNSFSYHFVPAGSMMETGAHALGCTVFPGGTGQTEQQVQAMAELKPAGYIGTPSFLKIMVEKAAEMGVPCPA
jgi:phenylacetate-CoA ligase